MSQKGYLTDKVKCDQCDMTVWKSSLKIHVNRRHKKSDCKTLRCPKCGFTHDTRHELKRHRDTVCRRVQLDYKHPCQLCPAKKQSAAGLLKHMESVHFNLRKWKCQLCAHSANNRSNLLTHVKSRHPVKVINFVKKDTGIHDINQDKDLATTNLDDVNKKEEVKLGHIGSGVKGHKITVD